jgi:predicted glycosyltransferase
VTEPPTLLLYCQHSLGLGHLKRSWALARHFSRVFRVVLVSGGAPPMGLAAPGGIEIVELPALAQNEAGDVYAVDSSRSVDDVRRERVERLIALYRRLRPDVVVLELFPFGRRKFQAELLALLDETRNEPRPIVASSVRDLLVDRADRQTHDDRARDTCAAYFDVVLVHADPRFATLHDTFRPSRPMATAVHHTGFVVDENRRTDEGVRPRSGILVSGGGGRFAERLYAMAMDAHALLGDAAPPMTIVAGPLCPDDLFARLCTAAATRRAIRVERTVADLCGAMRGAAVSVSQCGYNTALDIVRAAVPAIVVPFDDNGDTEQTVRAMRLEQLQAVRVVRAAAGAAALAQAVIAVQRVQPPASVLDLSGGPRSTDILAALLRQRRRRREAAMVATR